MSDLDNPVPVLGRLLDQRMRVVGMLAGSLEASRLALVNRDAEAIARGAAHQAELCRQWGRLEDELRAEAVRRRSVMGKDRLGKDRPGAARLGSGHLADSPGAEHTGEIEKEWTALRTRIQYLTRVHCSLLRHMQRSLAILQRMVDSCGGTYRPDRGVLHGETHQREARPQSTRLEATLPRARPESAQPRTGE